MRSIVNISMPQEMAKLIEEEMTGGKYGSKSEFIRMLIKQWSKKKMRQVSKNSSTGIRVRAARTL